MDDLDTPSADAADSALAAPAPHADAARADDGAGHSPEAGSEDRADPAPRRSSRLRELISRRALSGWSVAGVKPDFVARTEALWRFLHDRYFRVETTGWERLPDGPVILVGVHAGTWLTMDAWMLGTAWWFKFRDTRWLHCTCHDVLMAMPGLGKLFRQVGVIPASRESVSAALDAGHSVVIWPGGEIDCMRSWARRGEVELAGRRGFIRQAMRSGVPIVPVATVGGADTVFVLSEGRWLAEKLQLKRFLRSEMAPIVAGLPFGVWLEVFPSHIPLPSKIRYEFLDPIHLDHDPAREDDQAYVDGIYDEVQARLQAGVDKLMAERKYPILG